MPPILNLGQPVVDPQVTFTPEELSKSMQKYRKELILMPMFAMGAALQHMGHRDGIRYKEHIHEMKGNFQMGNYDKYKKGDGAVEIVERTLETFFGNCIEPIDPNSIVQTLWGSDVTKGEALKNVDWVKRVCAYIFKKLGENMFLNMWTAKHDPAIKNLTSAWFNGFCTIEDAEIAAGTMAKELQNLYYLPEAFTAANTEDLINDFYWGDAAAGWPGVHTLLRGQNTKLFMSETVKHYYEVAYQTNHGALPYNLQFNKAHLEGKPNVEFVALPNVPENYLSLTPKGNILALWNLRTADETFLCEKSLTSHYDVDFLANMFYGEQYESINKEKLCVARYNGIEQKDYTFTSYGEGGTVELATGKAATTGGVKSFSGVKYNEILVTENSVEGFAGNKYFIIGTATANGTTKYPLYDAEGHDTGMTVTITAVGS
jgi:hypothetical protein